MSCSYDEDITQIVDTKEQTNASLKLNACGSCVHEIFLSSNVSKYFWKFQVRKETFSQKLFPLRFIKEEWFDKFRVGFNFNISVIWADHWMVSRNVTQHIHGARILSLLLSLRKLSILSTRGGEFLDFRFRLNLSMFSPNTSPVLRAEIRSSNSVWSWFLENISIVTELKYFKSVQILFWRDRQKYLKVKLTPDVHLAGVRWSNLTIDWRCFSYAPGFSFSSKNTLKPFENVEI